MLAILEVTMENLLFANRNRLFIIRPTESQLPVCDCQPEGQTDRQTERVRKEGCFLPLHKDFLPFLARNGARNGGQDSARDTFWSRVLIHNFGIVQTADSRKLVGECQL